MIFSDNDDSDDFSSFPNLVDDQDKKDAERRGIKKMDEAKHVCIFNRSC